MIRHRLSELGSAVARSVEMLRAAKHVEEVAQAVLELLGQAVCSERAKTPDNLVLVERLGFRLGHALEELRHGNARLHRGESRMSSRGHLQCGLLAR